MSKHGRDFIDSQPHLSSLSPELLLNSLHVLCCSPAVRRSFAYFCYIVRIFIIYNLNSHART